MDLTSPAMTQNEIVRCCATGVCRTGPEAAVHPGPIRGAEALLVGGPTRRSRIIKVISDGLSSVPSRGCYSRFGEDVSCVLRDETNGVVGEAVFL
jgi:hypothetical protein